MQRREDQMPCESGLDRDLGSFEVADLADQDDVRVLPEERSERGREIQTDRPFI
jgi:hypothetical protein